MTPGEYLDWIYNTAGLCGCGAGRAVVLGAKAEEGPCSLAQKTVDTNTATADNTPVQTLNHTTI